MARTKVFAKTPQTTAIVITFIVIMAIALYLIGSFFGFSIPKIGLAFLLGLIFFNMNLTSCQIKYRAVWFNITAFFLCFILIATDKPQNVTDAMFIYSFLICLISTHLGHFNYQVLQKLDLLYLIAGDSRYF